MPHFHLASLAAWYESYSPTCCWWQESESGAHSAQGPALPGRSGQLAAVVHIYGTGPSWTTKCRKSDAASHRGHKQGQGWKFTMYDSSACTVEWMLIFCLRSKLYFWLFFFSFSFSLGCCRRDSSQICWSRGNTKVRTWSDGSTFR